jgi:RNA polymerase sigma-70 factor (ECF subfamily)
VLLPADALPKKAVAEPPVAPDSVGKSSDDAELLRRIAADDQGAFELVFRQHYAGLVAFANRLLGSYEVAEDSVQEVLLNLWRQRATLRIEESLRSYLYRAVRNRSLNQIRNERVRREAVPYLVHDAPTAKSGDLTATEGEIDAAIRDAIAALPPRCREVFELSRLQGLRYTEIAATLGISVKTVETQMGRALKSLRERLAAFRP